MQVIIHYPQDSSNRKSLADRMAEILARMAVSRLENLPLSDSGKLKILDFILDNHNLPC